MNFWIFDHSLFKTMIMTKMLYSCFHLRRGGNLARKQLTCSVCVYAAVLQLIYNSELTSYLKSNLPTWYFLSIGNCKSISPTFSILISFSVLVLVAFIRALVCGQNTSICRWKFNLSKAHHRCNTIVTIASDLRSQMYL